MANVLFSNILGNLKMKINKTDNFHSSKASGRLLSKQLVLYMETEND